MECACARRCASQPGPDGTPWLDESRLSEAVSSLTRAEVGKLIEPNERMTERLLEGVSVAGLLDWDQGRTQGFRFIDFDDPYDNDFLAINQFRWTSPGVRRRSSSLPDVVLFVNGIPLVVIECKSPYVTDPMAEGINQLRRYANQRDLGAPEGNEQLFWTNQFVVSTYGDKARVGTFTAGAEHYLEWRDTAPMSRDDLARQLGKPVSQLSGSGAAGRRHAQSREPAGHRSALHAVHGGWRQARSRSWRGISSTERSAGRCGDCARARLGSRTARVTAVAV